MQRRAFTLVELLIVVAIIAILGTFSFLSLSNRRSGDDLADAKQQIAATLREAQSRSVSQDKNVAWGVHFSNSTTTPAFYALFYSSYSTGTISGYYSLPSSVAYVTSTLAVGSSMDIIFSQISGASSASTSIGLHSLASPSLAPATISISNSGAVSF